MEGVTASVYQGLKGYWKRRGYQRLGGTGRRRKIRVQLAGSGSKRWRRFWRIKITLKLKLKFRLSPKKFFIGLRDTYVNMMLRLANTRVMSSGGGYAGDSIGGGFGMGSLKEYDERMIIEIYKSLVMAQSQLVPRDAPRFGTDIVRHDSSVIT